MMSCACSAGPAFEGGGISCGMRASNGAIEKVKIDEKTLNPTLTTIGDADPIGICGSRYNRFNMSNDTYRNNR